MLVHTSQKQEHHAAIAEAIQKWIADHQYTDLPVLCREIYEKETNRVSKDAWLNQIGSYGIPAEKIRDYPKFDDILPFIDDILSMEMQYIKMSEDGILQYHKGLHLVIDNCANNGIRNGDDHVRLAYPDPESPDRPDFCTAFIIVGGSTLARGLTIEGLVSTFFLRASCQADTLMQMGRWFGYRKGYELLPRIWMTEDTTEKFQFLAELEIDLRADLRKYMVQGVKPSEYAPRLRNSPKVSWLRLTSKKHMQNAEDAELDFTGARPQTFTFDRNIDIQQQNIAITESFLSALPAQPRISSVENCILWTGISLDVIVNNLLSKFNFCACSRVFNEMGSFCDWLKALDSSEVLKEWSVIVAGKDTVTQGVGEIKDKWNVCGYQIGKVVRTAKIVNSDMYKDVINIGVLRSLRDCVADVPEKYIPKKFEGTQIAVDDIRRKAGMDTVPQLIIYRIDQNSAPRTGSKSREPLNFGSDIIGLHICVPGDQLYDGFVKSIRVQLPASTQQDTQEEDE